MSGEAGGGLFYPDSEDEIGPAAPSSLPAEEDFRTALTNLIATYALDVQAGRPANVIAAVMDDARIRFNTETRDEEADRG